MTDKSFESEDLSRESIEDEIETKNETDKENQKGKSDEEEDSVMNINLIESISEALITILEENKKLENYTDIIKSQNKMIFSSNSIPKISIKDYLIRIQTYSCIEKSTLILAMILIDHLNKKSELILTYYNIHRILFGAILISIKLNEDSYYDNKFYSQIAGVSMKELKIIEYTFLDLNDYNVFVDNNEYEQYLKYLEN